MQLQFDRMYTELSTWRKRETLTLCFRHKLKPPVTCTCNLRRGDIWNGSLFIPGPWLSINASACDRWRC